MTNKTREEKIKRLMELSPWKEDHIAENWIDDYSSYGGCTREQYLHDKSHADSDQRKRHARATWDVCTGIAFTKLYKALA